MLPLEISKQIYQQGYLFVREDRYEVICRRRLHRAGVYDKSSKGQRRALVQQGATSPQEDNRFAPSFRQLLK